MTNRSQLARPLPPCRSLSRLRSVLLILIAAGLVGCSGSYEDLEGAFGVEDGVTGDGVGMVEIVLVSTTHRGAYTLHPDVILTDSTVEIRPRFPLSLFHRDLSLPASAISGCSMTCFGMDDKNADLLFEDQGVKVSFGAAPEMVDWCWQEGLPMLSGESVRGWQYSGRALPAKAEYSQVDKEEYEQQANSACTGY